MPPPSIWPVYFAPFAENTNQQADLIGDLFWLDAHALDRAPDVVEKALLEAGIAGDDARMSADALAWRCDMLGGLLG